jgi:hypothetical protein
MYPPSTTIFFKKQKSKKKVSTSLLLEWLPVGTQATTNIDRDVGEKEPSYTAGVSVN